jgi:hypothetical protein
MAAAGSHSRRPSRCLNSQEARIRVNGSSSTRTGSTTDSCPPPSAVACSKKPAVIARIPPNHTGWCSKVPICRRLMFSLCGTRLFALRCSTEETAFEHAASTARA